MKQTRMILKRLTTTLLFSITASLLFLIGCTSKNKQDLLSTTICDTIDTKFSTVVNQIIVTQCNTQSGCHGSPSFGSISLEGYQNVKDNYASILTRIKSGNMPKNNPALDACSILKIETWINRGAQNN
jgi:hypothetical protein